MIQNLSYSTDAGVTRAIKTGANSLEINDGTNKTALVSDPVSSSTIRTRGKASNVAGVTGRKVESNLSVAYRN